MVGRLGGRAALWLGAPDPLRGVSGDRLVGFFGSLSLLGLWPAVCAASIGLFLRSRRGWPGPTAYLVSGLAAFNLFVFGHYACPWAGERVLALAAPALGAVMTLLSYAAAALIWLLSFGQADIHFSK